MVSTHLRFVIAVSSISRTGWGWGQSALGTGNKGTHMGIKMHRIRLHNLRNKHVEYRRKCQLLGHYVLMAIGNLTCSYLNAFRCPVF